MVLTFLIHSAIVSAISTLTSILSASFRQLSEGMQVQLSCLRDQPHQSHSTAQFDTLRPFSHFLTLKLCPLLPLSTIWSAQELSWLNIYLNPNPLFRFLVTVLGPVPSASLIYSNSTYDLWASLKMNVTRQDSLVYIRVLYRMVPICPATIFACMILEFIDSLPVGVSASLFSL
jgi:hypothetical protein